MLYSVMRTFFSDIEISVIDKLLFKSFDSVRGCRFHYKLLSVKIRSGVGLRNEIDRTFRFFYKSRSRKIFFLFLTGIYVLLA